MYSYACNCINGVNYILTVLWGLALRFDPNFGQLFSNTFLEEISPTGILFIPQGKTQPKHKQSYEGPPHNIRKILILQLLYRVADTKRARDRLMCIATDEKGETPFSQPQSSSASSWFQFVGGTKKVLPSFEPFKGFCTYTFCRHSLNQPEDESVIILCLFIRIHKHLATWIEKYNYFT